MDILKRYEKRLKVLNLKVYPKKRKWEIFIEKIKPIEIHEICELEKNIKINYSLNEVAITIFSDNDTVSVNSLVSDKWSELINLVTKKHPGFIGFLKNSKAYSDGECIIITVESKTCFEYLKSRNFEKILNNLIMKYYNADYIIKVNYFEEIRERDNYVYDFIKEEKKIIQEVINNTYKKKSDNNNQTRIKENSIIYGKDFDGEFQKISDIAEDSGRISIKGIIFSKNLKKLNNGKSILTFNISDYTDSITVKMFLKEQNEAETFDNTIFDDMYIKLRGDIQMDSFTKELVVYPISIVQLEVEKRIDTASQKRIELHCHTTMSSMDGICTAKQLISRAKEWGHKAIAITDHGVVQAYPEAYEASKKLGIKIVYGVEAYYVNDGIPIVYDPVDRDLIDEIIVFDIETTGLDSNNDRITEIAAVRLKNNEIVETFCELINPDIAISQLITELTGITNEMVCDKPKIQEVLPRFLDFIGNCPVVAHNALFDTSFIRVKCEDLGYKFENCIIDTLQMSKILVKDLKKYKLDVLCKYFKIELNNHHRALADATATAYVFVELVKILQNMSITNICEINSINKVDYKKAEVYHIILIAKNSIGLKNLYKLISISHLEYFYKKPRILKSILMKYREGLIIGSACEAGEIFKNILNGMDYKKIFENAKLYDYLEVQPDGNNEFLIRTGRLSSIEELRKINRKIIEIADKLGKIVVATGDVHFLDPKDEVYRRILMTGQGYSDAEDQPPLYYKTTDEMLDEFHYLGREKAYEIVVENTNKIVDSIEHIIPIPEETFPPKIEGSEEQIREMTISRAHFIYGDILPDIVQNRLEKELNSIINNGYAVMYLIAQKLVSKSLQDGYLVGSRGSVGSSFVATMSGITEVNPLPPHYICPKCKYSYFYTDGSIGSGADLPDKKCPQCGTDLNKDGHDIPFEVFLGFEGDKEPDIDLNFAGEYQPEAHKYTEELFGKGYVFRAGTIGTIADKTAYGFVKKYFDQKNRSVKSAEIERLVKGCTGVKRTTGQHPGGVMIVPSYKEIFEFTPIQRPADDTTSNIITTHFDYHSISGRLLKLDILGHDVPTIIKMLEDITNIKAQDIKLDDSKTMSIFTGTDVYNISLDEIDCKVGTLGIPEFGTKFVRQMLMDTKPTTFAELVRIAGLSHGTDVWLNNAQDLIRNGITKLNEVISTRDDIMLYLIYKGVKPKNAFKIMENVRKGKGLTLEHEQAMKEQNVPDWYIESCKRIKYMFPKAHAVAYVMMSFRIAYYKVYYPEAFYATYFTIKIEDFDSDLFCKGKQAVLSKWKEINSKGNLATTKEKNILTLLESVFEMYERGIKLLKVDLYNSSADKFLIVNDEILPPLNSLQGLGIAAAQNIVNARSEEQFVSIDDFRERSKVSKTVIEILKNHGCLDGMPENSQLTMF